MIITENPKIANSLKGVIHNLKEEKNLNPSAIVRIIKNANVQAEDLKNWEDFDHPRADSYGRKLIYQGDNFELMVMSWRPGDFSAIHDHGQTKWGAVQIFGPAEHATFRLEDDHLSTLARWKVAPKKVLGVSNSLIHQMGNPTSDQFFVSLHVYGTNHETENITGDARIFDLEHGNIQRVDGGVFFGLPEAEVNSIEAGITSDFATQLRHLVEYSRRLLKIKEETNQKNHKLNEVLEKTFSSKQLPNLLLELQKYTNDKSHIENSIYWKNLNNELIEASKLQDDLQGDTNSKDDFHQYAEMYDALICQPMLDSFMANYLTFFKENFVEDISSKSIISLGVGTGLIEQYMLEKLGVQHNNLYGIDISEAMVEEARKRIQADVGDVLQLDPEIRVWDIAYSGLNVFHYLDHAQLEAAIKKTASIIKEGGWFLGDFITPDHIRWYPNVMFSKNKKIVSLRTPKLIEEDGKVFQQAEITNIDFSNEQMIVNYAGKHKRFLPPLHRIRIYFEEAFGSEAKLYDAHSLEPIPNSADTCPSTRYVVIIQKKKTK
ncbi:MAG: methyltransferase domain-containing protein [Polaribacter sp.]